ncbi:MAG: hypothetical protein VB092_00435 [Oscillospiraceae bacterium]|nr:hypothetical protein [Oscillospiraceae bacterium]
MRFLEMVAGFCGVFDVDLDTEFEGDGYTDASGRAPLREAFFISDMEPARRTPARVQPEAAARRGA